MAEKKHPVLIALVIFAVIAILLGSMMAVIIKMTSSSTNLSFSDKIGVIPINGPITDPQAIISHLIKFKKDKSIKAIILRINSPGGAVGPTQEIYLEVRRTIQNKKVIASIAGIAASGGYYIASAANKIVANPGSITGSIGVIMKFIHIENILDKIGIKFEVFKSGEFKDMGSSHRKPSEREKEIINTLIQDIQKQFVEAVADGRGLPVKKILKIADGRIFSGERAKELGLVDVLGNFQDAVELAKNMADITGEPRLVYPKKSKLELWDLIIESSVMSILKLSQRMRILIEYRWNSFLDYGL